MFDDMECRYDQLTFIRQLFQRRKYVEVFYIQAKLMAGVQHAFIKIDPLSLESGMGQ